MFAILLVIHIIACLMLIAVVLMQSGKGGLGAAFGGGETFFGGRGAAPFLATATTVLAVMFMATSLTLALISGRQRKEATAIERSLQQEQQRPGTPAREAPQGQPGQPGETPAFPSGR